MMKKRLITILLAVMMSMAMISGLVGCKHDNGTEEESESANTISVMTYNIRVYAASTSVVDTWDFRKLPLVQHIGHYAPDLVGMQEVLSPVQIDYLEEQLTEYKWIGAARERSKEESATHGEGCYIFYKDATIELLEWDYYWLSETPDRPSTGWDATVIRMAMWARFKIKETGTEFYHFNTHLDHIAQESRENGARMIVEDIAARDLPAILTGDFNFNEENPAYETVSEALSDSKYAAAKTMDGGTFHNYQTVYAPSPIDFIFVTRNNITVHEYKILAEKWREFYTSDHFAVQARLTIQSNIKS